ncbi:hypothetical protein EGW08_020433, partial [Elysia chlorotica]
GVSTLEPATKFEHTTPTGQAPCRVVRTPVVNATPTKRQVQEKVEEIVTHLSVQPEKLSSVKRSKTSAPDLRASSTTMGLGGIIFIGALFGLLIVSDFSKIVHDLRFFLGSTEGRSS